MSLELRSKSKDKQLAKKEGTSIDAPSFAYYTIEELTGGAYSVDTDYVGIEEVESAPHSQSSAIYDLMGRKLDKATERGIYIVEGKKVIF